MTSLRVLYMNINISNIVIEGVMLCPYWNWFQSVYSDRLSNAHFQYSPLLSLCTPFSSSLTYIHTCICKHTPPLPPTLTLKHHSPTPHLPTTLGAGVAHGFLHGLPSDCCYTIGMYVNDSKMISNVLYVHLYILFDMLIICLLCVYYMGIIYLLYVYYMFL